MSVSEYTSSRITWHWHWLAAFALWSESFGTCSGAPDATSTSTSIVKRAALPRPPPASAIFNLSHYNINQLQQLDDPFSRPSAYIPETKKQKKQYHEISDRRSSSCPIVDRGRSHTKPRLKTPPALFAAKEFNKQKV